MFLSLEINETISFRRILYCKPLRNNTFQNIFVWKMISFKIVALKDFFYLYNILDAMQHIQLYASYCWKLSTVFFFLYRNKIFLTPLSSLFTGLAGNSWFYWKDLFICYIFVILQVITKCFLVLRWMRQSVLGATHVTHVCESLKQFWRYTFSTLFRMKFCTTL